MSCGFEIGYQFEQINCSHLGVDWEKNGYRLDIR